MYLELRFAWFKSKSQGLDKYFDPNLHDWGGKALDALVKDEAVYFDILRWFHIPISESHQFKLKQLILYRAQIQRMEKEDIALNAAAIAKALGGDKGENEGMDD